MKRLAVTMGDPGGVGPEVAIKALLSSQVQEGCRAYVVGERHVLEEALSLVGRSGRIRAIAEPEDFKTGEGEIPVIEVEGFGRYQKGGPSREGGSASLGYIRKAVALAMEGLVDGIVTAPISKEAIRMAGATWPGHTEMLAEITGSREFAMVLVGGPLRVILATIHVPLSTVPGMITRKKVQDSVRLGHRACSMLGIEGPKIAVAGLNPHSGEGGGIGKEEEEIIGPAVEALRKEGYDVVGPIPPDVVFRRAYKKDFDIVVCMYHDQGLIPLKMIAFDEGVNFTVGLPIIRTSPDHGTAFDIAWKGLASSTSMIEAIKLASTLKI